MGRMIRFATWPARKMIGAALDLMFGKAEEEVYVSRTGGNG